MKKILIVVAHPDDEVIFFWWALQNPEWQGSILCCSSDANNPLRKKWARRKNGLMALCDTLKIPCQCLDYGSEFYKLDGRSGALADFERDVIASAKMFEFDAIATHNRWGEYGMMDHILINNIITVSFQNVLVSNIFTQSEWCPYTAIGGCAGVLPEDALPFENNLDKYAEWESIYSAIRCWTWSKEPVKSCLVKRA